MPLSFLQLREIDMDTVKKELNFKNDYPFCVPWSIKTLIIWLVGFLCFGAFMGLLIGLLYIFIPLDKSGVVYLTNVYGLVIYLCGLIVFIYSRLKKSEISINAIWGNKKITFSRSVLPFYIGVVVAYCWTFLILESKSWIPTYDMTTLIIYMISVTVLGPVIEEVYFRGLLYVKLKEYFTREKAIILSALIFSSYHIDYWFNIRDLIFVFINGILAAYFFEYTKSLTASLIFHSSANFTHNLILQANVNKNILEIF